MDSTKIFEILEESNKVPSLPQPVSEIFYSMYQAEKLDMNELSKKVSKCSELSELLISCVNSSYFELKRNVTTVNEAIVYLGLRTVRNLLLSFTFQLLLPKKLGRANQFNREKYWKHSIGTSIASSMLAEKTGLCKGHELFSYGLIHDIGIAVLDICLPEVIDQVIAIQHKGVYQIPAERIVMDGLTHSDIGAWLCKKWKLPEDIRNIVEYHHKPLLAQVNSTEVKLMNLGDIISTAYYEKLLGLNLYHGFSTLIMESVGTSEEYMGYIGKILPEEVERVDRLHVFRF